MVESFKRAGAEAFMLKGSYNLPASGWIQLLLIPSGPTGGGRSIPPRGLLFPSWTSTILISGGALKASWKASGYGPAMPAWVPGMGARPVFPSTTSGSLPIVIFNRSEEISDQSTLKLKGAKRHGVPSLSATSRFALASPLSDLQPAFIHSTFVCRPYPI